MERRARADAGLAYRRAADATSFAGSPVDEIVELEITGRAVGADVIAKRAAALCDGSLQYVANRFDEPAKAHLRAESPRIVIAQQRAVVEYDIDMVVRPAGRRVVEDAERSRHAEVNEQGRSTCVKQQILAAAIDALDRASPHAGVEVCGNRPAQSRVVYVDPNHAPARDMRRDSTPGRFDFGEFRHAGEPAIDGMRRWRQ